VTSQELPRPIDGFAALGGRPIELACFGLATAYVVFLAASLAQGFWLFDTRGLPIETDFVNVWAAGRLALEGQAPAAYDWVMHKQMEVVAVGHPFDKYFGWHYPPPFLLAAALLAFLPYSVAFAAWMAVTLPAYLLVIRNIIGHRAGLLLAAAFPAALWNLAVGQNGFVTAALLGGSIAGIDRQPLLAGALLGLLSYKPQFGLLFPLVLAVAGRWRVIAAAAVSAGLIAAASWLAFGTATWTAFLHSVPLTNQIVLSDGLADWAKLQSLFGLVRSLGGSDELAWSLQALLAAVAAAALCLLWRSSRAFEIKAAALALGTLVATPYVYVYDLVALAVPMAFLVHHGARTGFRSGEKAALAGATLLLLFYPLLGGRAGPLAMLLLAWLIARRALQPAADVRAAAVPAAV
jgi:hypothetical protein